MLNVSIPTKYECCYILEMLESGLIDFSYVHPWAGQVIAGLEASPSWFTELAIEKYSGAQARALREYIYSEPLEEHPKDLEKFHVACLWLRYERRELSWATFLGLAGSHLDAANADWECETPYHYLNVHEDAYFSPDSEQQTRVAYLADQDLAPWIAVAREKFEPFKTLRTADKASTADRARRLDPAG